MMVWSEAPDYRGTPFGTSLMFMLGYDNRKDVAGSCFTAYYNDYWSNDLLETWKHFRMHNGITIVYSVSLLLADCVKVILKKKNLKQQTLTTFLLTSKRRFCNNYSDYLRSQMRETCGRSTYSSLTATFPERECICLSCSHIKRWCSHSHISLRSECREPFKLYELNVYFMLSRTRDVHYGT